MADKDIETRMEQLEQQNSLLLKLLEKVGSAPQEAALPSPQIVNNGWKPLFNPKHRNADNRDWEPGTLKRWDEEQGYKQGYGTFHTGDGKWEWGYQDPETGKIKWSGKLIGEYPPGPPAEPPIPLEELERQLVSQYS